MQQLPKIVLLARIGFAARGLIYILIGWIALRTGRTESNAGILEYLNGGAGRVLLAIVALGLVGYGIWRLANAFLDTEGKGDDIKGLVVRAAGAISGLVHFGLAAVAVSLLARGDGGGASGGDGAQEGAQSALALPGGSLLLIAAAIAFLGAGLYQLVKAVKLDFLKHIDPKASRRAWIAWIGRIGFAARGAIFIIIAFSLWRAGTSGRAAEAQGTGEALAAFPPDLQLAVAAGLVLFGIFSFVEARYREITDPHVIRRLKGLQPALR